MIDKRVYDFDAALDGMSDGATIMSAGFGAAGAPQELLEAVLDRGFRDLVIISNNAGEGERGLILLLKERRIAKVICSFPTSSNSEVTKELYAAGLLELEIVPQGTLSERMRAGGAGIGGFYTPTSVNTPLAEGKEVRNDRWQRLRPRIPPHRGFRLHQSTRSRPLGQPDVQPIRPRVWPDHGDGGEDHDRTGRPDC